MGLALDPLSDLSLALTVLRARRKWRQYQVEELLRSMGGDSDPMGVGRVISLLAALEVRG